MRGVLLVVYVLGACATGTGGVTLTQHDIEAFGRHSYTAEPARVFEATKGALRAQGYGLAFAEQQTGLIKTGRRRMGWVRSGPQTLVTYRQLEVHIDPAGQSTYVTVVPYLFIGEEDVSRQDYWDLNVERTVWTGLFQDIDQFLSAPKVMDAPGTPAL